MFSYHVDSNMFIYFSFQIINCFFFCTTSIILLLLGSNWSCSNLKKDIIIIDKQHMYIVAVITF